MAKEQLTSTGMYNDVMAQPGCWDALLRRDLRSWQGAMGAARNGLLVGMGSSHYAALAASPALWAGGATWQALTADFALHYLPERVNADTVLAISQSGESSDTLQAAEKLRGGEGISLLAITNNEQSRLAEMSGVHLCLGCGEEKGSSTKTYTTSVLALLASNPEWVERLSGIAERGRAILEGLRPGDVPPLDRDHVHYFLGTGPNVATALEAALICKEKLFLHTEGGGAAEFAHGPLEVLDDASTVWLFSTAARIDDLLLPMAKRIALTGARLAVIGEQTARFNIPSVSPDWTLDIDLRGPDELGALLFILPMQLAVLWEADRHGYPIDTFRRMDKVMTGYDYGVETGRE